ncbi:MAG: hypothetical protein ACT4PE_05515 [Candidatus Eiseniibacteriota bacterium]
MPDKEAEQTTLTDPKDDTEPRDQAEDRGTPEDAERDADEATEPDYKAIHLANKETIEGLKRQLDEVNEKLARGTQPAPEEQSMQEDLDQRAAAMDKLRRLADVDPVAAFVLQQQEEVQRIRQDTMDAFTLSKLPVEKQQPVLQFYEKYRSHFPSLAACIEYVRGREAQSRVAELEKKLEELQKTGGGADKEREELADVVRTGGRDVNRTTYKAQTMSKDTFDQRQREFRAQGRHEEAMAEQDKLLKGKIVLKG